MAPSTSSEEKIGILILVEENYETPGYAANIFNNRRKRENGLPMKKLNLK